jgi:hypothetical protein
MFSGGVLVMSRMRVALALALMAFTTGVSFVPHPANAMMKLQTCEPKGDLDPDDGDPDDYDCRPN